MSKTFTHGGLSARFDVSDWRQMERAEAAINSMAAAAEEMDAAPAGIERLKRAFFAVAGVLDAAFDDEDAANKALGGTASLDDALTAVFAFVEFVKKQDADTAARWAKITDKYSPRSKK